MTEPKRPPKSWREVRSRQDMPVDQYFMEVGAQLHPELPGRNTTYRKRVMELLSDDD